MRILAIRGKNLASLANEFEVLLEAGVLQQAGLFAITGRTGAGKSTILDALCLALYDQMPRLPEGYGVAIGHKDEDETARVKSNDVSSILRRGTASAYAEVDFIGKDKHSYQARWEISRARGKVTGKLQPQKISLINLNTQEKIGEGKRDTLVQIVDKIGLNFDQFRRSVLLAQGDFAAFLKAKKDDRSSLLEKITGTDIYSELSIAAFERAKLEKQRLEQIEQKLADKLPLDKDTRATLELEKQEILATLGGVEQALKQQQLQLDWFHTLEQLTQALQQAEQVSQQAVKKWEQNEGNQDLLTQVEQVQVLRPLLTQEQGLAVEVQDAEQKLSQNQQALQPAEQFVSSLNQQLVQDQQLFAQAEQQSHAAEPLLIAARELDTQITGSAERLKQLTQQCDAQQEIVQTVTVQFEQLNTQKQQQENSLQQLAIWQEQQIAIQPLANEWGRWHADLNELLGLQNTLKLQTEAKAKQQKLIQSKQSELEQLQSDNASTLTEKDTLNQQLAQLEIGAEQHSLADLHQQKSRLEQDQQASDAAIQLIEKSFILATSTEQDSSTIASIATQQAELKNESAELKQQQVQLATQLDEAQKALSLMQAASHKTAESLRGLLTDDAPCPVCGATEHPWSDLLHAVNQPVAEQQVRVKALAQEKEGLIATLSEHASEAKQLAKDHALLLERIKQSKQDTEKLSAQWAQITLLDKPDWQQIQQADLLVLQTQSAAIKSAYALAKQREDQALALQGDITKVRTQAEAVNQTSLQQTAVLVELDKALVELRSTLVAKQELQASLAEDQQRLTATLSLPMQEIEHWQDELAQAGEQFVQKIADLVSQWYKKSTEQVAGQQLLDELEKQSLLIAADQEQQNTLDAKYQQEQSAAAKHQQQLLEQRSVYFNGMAATDYAQQISQQLRQATEKKQHSTEQLSQAKAEIKTIETTIAHWLSEQQRRQDKKILAEQALDAELAERQISKALLRELLAKDESWVVAQKSLQQALSKARQETQAEVKIKSAALQAHNKQVPEQDPLQVKEQMQALLSQQEQLQLEKDNRLYALRADDEKILASQALQASLTAQRDLWEQWESLNELIGSQKGHKFRIFAQGLTLETLLSYTNSHLQEFAQRYHLQRVPGSDLELQVIDRDMADEVRSVHSLSGGESFLVSLALALGLASLSSNRIQVESLFIDEGFGSLDAETLDIAIASLDTLQSLGRKVGVISHVPVLVERIGVQVVVEKVGEEKVSFPLGHVPD